MSAEVDVRASRTRDELVAAMSAISHFFGRPPRDDFVDLVEQVSTPERVHAAFMDGRTVGGAGVFPFRLTVPGGVVSAAGVTVVGVLPTHRRRGILTQLMRAQLDDVHAREEPVALLWASEGAIYPRFGYGVASLAGDVEIVRAHASFAFPFEAVGSTRLVDGEEALALLPPVYERVAAETAGMFARSETWWRDRILADPEWRRGGGGELTRVVWEGDGRVEGYALYRVTPSWDYGSSTGVVDVIEALGATTDATRELWRYLLDIDWLERVRARLLPVDHPLFLLLAEPRRMRFTVGEALWVRLVDVGAALSARSYDGDDEVVFEVADRFCAWNEGRWRLADGVAERTGAEPDLRSDVTVLGSVYLGGFTFAELARAGRVEELRPGAIARADRLFRADRAPWCPEIF
jgi:predicted acetyltransferase